jgi:hypothetical protein
MTLDDICNIALARPEVEEGASYGAPTLKERKRRLPNYFLAPKGGAFPIS